MPKVVEKINFVPNTGGIYEYSRREEIVNDLKIMSLNLLVSFLCYYQLEICNKNYLFNGFIFTFVNILMVYSFIEVLGMFTYKIWIAAVCVSALSTVFSIINFYTVLFRNQPASPLDIGNIKTAVDVLGSYKPGFNWTVVLTILLFALCVYVSLKMKKLERIKTYNIRQYIAKVLLVIFLTFGFYYCVFFAENSLKPKLTLVWSWEESYHEYGYLASSEEMLVKSFNVVRKPDNYDEEALKEYAKESKPALAKDVKKPDIILILNETFYDLSLVTDLKADKEIMPFIKNLDNKIHGYAFVPGVGGGTNRSEYELLSSNSLSLMPGITPFSFLDLNDAESIVSFLKDKGYETWASHAAPSLNYSRGIAYPKLGFDKIVFNEGFPYRMQYGKRPYSTDEQMYDKIVEDYKKMGDGPRFMYALTIQNHGGWDMNPPEEDTVRAKKDFGKIDSEIDEYLSCMALSDAAFSKLVNYYKTVDRDVIICMVGDHAPSWIEDVADETDDEFEKMKVCATPFVIWANYDIEDKNLGYTSLPFIVPTMLKNSGLKLSPFYDFMLKMQKKYPTIFASTYYTDSKNKMFSYETEEIPKEIKMYFDMVYNNASKKAGKVESIFSGK